MTTVGSDSSGTSAGLRRYKFREAVRTDIGLRRNENQDAYGIAHTASTSLFIVADGMGGARGGATASTIAVHVIANLAIKENGLITRPSLQTAIERANQIIHGRSKKDEDLSGMGTTVVALAFVNECAIVAHVGDSRIYRLRENQIKQLTHDHTLVQELVDTGAIPIEEAENHPIAHMLTRSLGPTDSVDVEIQALAEPTQRGDRFLLCSDGLYNLVSEAELAEHLGKGTPDEVVEVLVDLALERGGTDNVTVEVLEVYEMSEEEPAVDYPDEGEVRIALSEGVAIGNIETLLEEDEEPILPPDDEDELLDDPLQLRPVEDGVSDDTEGRLDAVLDDDLPLGEPVVSTPRVAKETRGDLFRIQAGVFFVIGLTAGILLYSIYQYQQYGIRSTLPPMESADPLPVVSEEQRDELARELETWITDGTSEGVDVTTGAPTFPEASLPSSVQGGSAEGQAAGAPAGGATEADLRVPPPPDVVIRGTVSDVKPDRPIVWENEQKRVERLLEELNAQQQPQEQLAGLATQEEGGQQSGEKLRSADEITKIIYQKNLVRERIGDIDAKLNNLAFENKSEAATLRTEIEQQINSLNAAIDERAEQMRELEKQLQVWKEYRRQAVGKRSSEFSELLEKQSEELRSVREAYETARSAYFKAFDAWEEQPNDVKRAAEMGERGRELQQAQVALVASVQNTIQQGLEKAALDLARVRLDQVRDETERDKLSRQEGYLRAFTVSTPERRKELKDSYLEERQALTEQLAELETSVPVEQELQFRQSVIIRSLLQN